MHAAHLDVVTTRDQAREKPCTKLNLGIFSSLVAAHVVPSPGIVVTTGRGCSVTSRGREPIFIHCNCNSLGLGQTITICLFLPNLIPFKNRARSRGPATLDLDAHDCIPSAISKHSSASSRAHVDGQDNDKIIQPDGNRLNMGK
jgi:hypothetical protein